MHVVNLHRLDPRNPGDLFSSPIRYFPFEGKALDIAAEPVAIACDLLIVGGGAIISTHPPFLERLDRWLNAITFRRAVIWGADVTPKMAAQPVMERFDLVGVRNVTNAFRFVPCASCLHPAFDAAPAGHGLGTISHWKRAIPNTDIPNAPNDFDTVVNFIRSRSTIVTTSYHAAYWAMLLGRRVYIYDAPTFRVPDKLRTFDQQPAVVGDVDQLDVSDLPPNQDLLARHRQLNRDFAEDVLRLMD